MKYMYFKLSIRKLKHSAVLVFLLLISSLAMAQADFTISPTIACAGVDRTSVNITTPGIAAADLISFTIRWGIPNDTAVNARIAGNPPNPFFSKQYINGGTYTITVVVKRNNGADVVIQKNVKIWTRPTTSFILASGDYQCFKNNDYCFNNTSKQGTAPLVKYEWTFGDGNYRLITDTNNRYICHRYALNNPAYQVGLKVTDSVGCTTDPQTDLLSAKGVRIAPNINPGFNIAGRAECDTSKFIYTNTTPMSFANVFSFTWDYGDGTTYVSGLPHTVTEDFNRWTKSYTHSYVTNNVFRPSLIVKDKSSGCIDTFYYEQTGLQLPENIIYQVELLTKRNIPNDSIADSVCLMTPGAATLTLYNKYDLQGPGGTPLDLQWHFHDPNANPPGSDVTPFRNVMQPTYDYKGLGQFFPTLTVKCPGATNNKTRTYTFYSKIDTLPKDGNRYQYWDYYAAPKTGVPQFTNPNGPQLNPILYTKNGRLMTPNTATNPYFYNYNGKVSAYQFDTIVSPVEPTLILGIYAKHIGWADSVSSSWDFFHINDNDCVNKWIDTGSTNFRNPMTGVLITVPYYREFCNPISRVIRGTDTLFRDRLIGLGVNILGPFVRMENPFPAGGPPPPRDVVLQWQKLQCGPTYPVQFVNNSLIYQSDRLWIRWDFAEDAFAPACTSYSVPNPSQAGGGLEPYTDAADLQNRTIGCFIANGRAYLGRLNICNYSHDSIPTRQYTNWDVAFDWNKYGHDFPPYDTTKWTKGYTTWPTSAAPPTGFTWVQPRDSGTWNKPMTAIGPTPTRIDTMVNIWPADIPANNIITLNRGIPDPISSSRGNWMDMIPAGTRIDSGQLVINLAQKANDGRTRTYRGSDIIPGISPPKTLYRYAFDRQVVQDITVTLRMKDSLNNISGDPDYRKVKTKYDTIQVYDPVTFGSKDSIIVDSLFLDDWDCNGSSTVTLSFTRPDAFGLSQDGKVCPNFKSGSSGGDPQLIFNRQGYIDSSRTLGGAGILPSSSRTMLLINYDSLLDRNDNTPCDLDGFVTWQGGVTPGGTTMPMMYKAVNYPPQPPRQWSDPSGSRAWLHYWPSGPTGGGVSNMPVDPKGWVTLGLIVGTGCFSPTNCTLPSCVSDTVWYHNFFRFIELNANFTTEKFGYEFPTKPAFCYLRGKGDEVTFHYFDSIQDNVIADVWDWGDGTATVDSFYYQPNEDIPYNRIRYIFNTYELPWAHSSTEYFPVGLRTSKDTVINKIYRCDDINHVYPPQRIDTIITTRDTSLMFTPIKHRYLKSSFEQMVVGGNGTLERRGDITPVLHNMVTNSFFKCENRMTKYLVIGVIDTFDIKNEAGEWDTVFCQGETVYFYDSIRYWYPSSNCTRPLNIPANENDLLNNDQGNMHNWAYTKYTYPNDSIKTNITFDLYDYLVYPGTTAVCPLTHIQRAVGTDALGNPIVRCFKNREYFHERIYWDFESDGVVDAFGPFTLTTPVTHKYPVHGRYKVSMISIDSTGRWDTCIQFVNVVKPVAFIEAKDVYICGDNFIFKDSSIIYDDYRISTGLDSLDRITSWKWWFGDRTYYPKAPQSILEDPIYDYRRNGKYTLRLAISTEQGCTDTAFKNIFISGPRPHLHIIDDTLGCVPHRVRVVSIPERESWSNMAIDTPTKYTVILSGRPDGYSDFIKYSTIDTVVFYYDQPGTYYITGIAYDNVDGSGGVCKPAVYPDTVDGFQKPMRIIVNVPYKVDVLTSRDTVCVGEVFTIYNKSDRDTINRFRLDVFDSKYTARLDSMLKTDYIADTSWSYRYNKVGQYHLVLNSTRFNKGFSPCFYQDTVTMVAGKAKADFTAVSVSEGAWRVTNTSDTSLSDKYSWKVYDLDGNMLKGFPIDFDESSDLNSKLLEFYDLDSTKSFNVCIIADVAGTHSCPDSVCKIIEVIVPKGKLKIPNVFTPNGDNVNDVFKIDISGQKKYSLIIWNRWGNTVFESDKPEKMWNGKTNNDGGENPAGTYYYLFNYQLRGGEEHNIRGTITLIRE